MEKVVGILLMLAVWTWKHEVKGMVDGTLDCKPRPILLRSEINKVNGRYLQVFRCGGNPSDHYTVYDACVSIKSSTISGKFRNDTQCGVRCICDHHFDEEPDQQCKDHRKAYDEKQYFASCYPGLRFNTKTCKCDLCEGPDPIVSPSGNTQSKHKGISITIFIISLVGEFIIVSLVCYVCFKSRRKNNTNDNPEYTRQESGHSLQQFTKGIIRQVSRTRDRNVEGSVSLLNNKNEEDGESTGSDVTHMEIDVAK